MQVSKALLFIKTANPPVLAGATQSLRLGLYSHAKEIKYYSHLFEANKAYLVGADAARLAAPVDAEDVFTGEALGGERPPAAPHTVLVTTLGLPRLLRLEAPALTFGGAH